MCDKFQILDGLWPLNHPHCAAPMTYIVTGFPKMKLPPICPNQPATGSVYCRFHIALASAKNQPCSKAQLELLRKTVTPKELEIFGTLDLQAFLSEVQLSNAEKLTFNEFM
ncbi:hypothetical protein BV898_18847 [Hypsibius exemplaris]|uniref:Uncharacterized protein n=1 Tax=Hypsibius exemplaris TaxID=2072580 RepID=A0A9X6NQR0_HYPEX|nr:hypothetical protein BV898_18847 [Hypsibius exemplaris]